MKIKRTWFITFSLLVTFMVSIPSYALVTPILDISDDYIVFGESFEVDVWIQNPDGMGDLTCFGFDVVTTDFSFTDWVVGPGFDDPRKPPWYISIPDDHVEGLNPLISNAEDYILLATLSFEADISVGTGLIKADGPYDGHFSGLYYENADESLLGELEITVHEFNPIPEPGTLLLVGMGLLGLAGIGRKKQ